MLILYCVPESECSVGAPTQVPLEADLRLSMGVTVGTDLPTVPSVGDLSRSPAGIEYQGRVRGTDKNLLVLTAHTIPAVKTRFRTHIDYGPQI